MDQGFFLLRREIVSLVQDKMSVGVLHQPQDSMGRTEQLQADVHLFMWRIKGAYQLHDQRVCYEVSDGAQRFLQHREWPDSADGSSSFNQQSVLNGVPR